MVSQEVVWRSSDHLPYCVPQNGVSNPGLLPQLETSKHSADHGARGALTGRVSQSEVPDPSSNHGAARTGLVNAIVQESTATLRRLLSRPAVLTELADQFLESDRLVKAITDLSSQKTEAHLHDVPEAFRLASEGLGGVLSRPVLSHWNEGSEDIESPERYSSEKNNLEIVPAEKSSRTVRDLDSDSGESH